MNITAASPSRRLSFGLLTLCLLLPAASLLAQANTTATDQEVVKLETFSVTAEIGTYAEVAAATATKTVSQLRDVPMSVTVMNHAFIDDLRAERLGDVYQYITGLSFNDPRSSTGITIRGMEGSSNLKNIQVDGLPGLSTRYSSPSTANVERVEVLKGAAAVLYGYMQPGGLVNIVTKRPQARRDMEVFVSVRSYASDLSGFGAELGYSTRLDATGPVTADKKLRYRLISEYEHADSFRKDRDMQNFYLMPSLLYAWRPESTLFVGFEYVRERRVPDEGLVAPLNREDLMPRFDVVYQNKNDREEDNGVVIAAEFKHRFQNDWQLNLSGRKVWHDDMREDFNTQGITIRTPVTDSLVTRRYRLQYNERNYAYVDSTLQREFQHGERTHRLLFGLTAGTEQNYFDRQAFQTTNPAAQSVNVYNPVLGAAYPAATPDTLRDIQIDAFGLYAQAQVGFTAKLKGVIAARYDKQEQDFAQQRPVRTGAAESSATVPSFGVVYQPTKQTSLYASYVESFHPVLNSFDRENINGVAGEWDPEEATQKEAGVKLDFPGHSLTVNAAVFEIEKSNVIERTALPNANGVNYWIVVGGIRSRGAEVEFQYRPRPHIQLRGGYAYIDASVASSLNATLVGAPVSNVPRHGVNLWARYNVPQGRLKGVGVGVGGIYQSDRYSVTTNNPATQFIVSSYYKVDTALYYNWRKINFLLNIKNVFDKRYVPGGGNGSAAGNVGFAPGEPRQLVLSARMSF